MMSDLLGVIFSRDRAMQLDAVLRSLFLHCQDANTVRVWILYTTSNEQHEEQYRRLAKEYSGRAFFKRQQNFRRDLLAYLNPFEKKPFAGFAFRFLCALGKSGPPLGSFSDRVWRRTVSLLLIVLSRWLATTIQEDRFVLFLVDDNIFIQDFYIKQAVTVLKQTEKLLGFSFRLGKNTISSYARNRKQTMPEFESLGNDMLQFNWDGADGDFGYPLEVSSSIYRLRDLLPLFMALSFDNPNILEDRMAFHSFLFRKKRPWLACYQRSVTFCNPINMVQLDVPNRAGESILYNADELSLKFERGERIQVEVYSGFVPHACHQEVDLIFGKHEN